MMPESQWRRLPANIILEAIVFCGMVSCATAAPVDVCLVNEAALNLHNEPLLEGDDPIEVNLELKKVIRP